MFPFDMPQFNSIAENIGEKLKQFEQNQKQIIANQALMLKLVSRLNESLNKLNTKEMEF